MSATACTISALVMALMSGFAIALDRPTKAIAYGILGLIFAVLSIGGER